MIFSCGIVGGALTGLSDDKSVYREGEMKFNWQLAFATIEGLILACIPVTSDGKQYPYSLSIWSANQGFYGEIALLNDGETIEFTGDSVFELIDRIQNRTIKHHEG